MSDSAAKKSPSIFRKLKNLVAPLLRKAASDQKPGAKDAAIRDIMKKTGWDKDYTVAQVEDAKKRIGITYTHYNKYNFHTIPAENQEKAYAAVLEDIALKQQQREENIAAVMQKTGWTYDQAVLRMGMAKTNVGISFFDYHNYRFHTVPAEEQAAAYQRILDMKAQQKATQSARRQQEREDGIATVMAATGWDREYTVAQMNQAVQDVGVTMGKYAVFRFWEMTPEQQKTFFVNRDFEHLKTKYNTDAQTLRTLRRKDLTCKKLQPWLGRPFLPTSEMTPERFAQCFAQEEKILYKPLSSFGGYGIEVFPLTRDTMEEVYHTIESYPPGLIEGYLRQHPTMQQLSCNAVNTIRFVTIMTRDEMPNVEPNKIHFVYAGLRMGSGSSYVDNLHGGGMIAHVDLETGILDTDGVGYASTIHTVHPDTGVAIKGFQIPYFQEAKQLILEAGKDLPGYLGWDIAISETGPVVIELNSEPGPGCLQLPYTPQHVGMRHVMEPYL